MLRPTLSCVNGQKLVAIFTSYGNCERYRITNTIGCGKIKPAFCAIAIGIVGIGLRTFAALDRDFFSFDPRLRFFFGIVYKEGSQS